MEWNFESTLLFLLFELKGGGSRYYCADGGGFVQNSFLLYFIGGFQKGLGDMKDAGVRLLALEHPLTMIIAIVLITIGWSKHKKQVKSQAKFKIFAIFYGIALLLILSRIPWSNWF